MKDLVWGGFQRVSDALHNVLEVSIQRLVIQKSLEAKDLVKVKQATDKVKTKVKQGADKVKTGVNKLPPGAKTGLAIAGTAAALIGAKDVIDATTDAVSGGDKKGDDKKPPTKPGAQPGDVYSTVTKTTSVAGSKGPAWWQSYEKAAPYHSSKKYYRNIRN